MRRRRHTQRLPLPAATVALVLAALIALVSAGSPALAREAFPEATPESRALSTQALRALADTVEDYVTRDMAVGAELLVIKDRRTVLHEAYGWRDREGQVPMEPDTLFNIRSMTKPITGAAIQILVDEGRLALDDRASDYLPGFDTEDSRDITIEQLLTHRSGLPLSTLQGTHDFESLYDMANAIGEGGPQFPPNGQQFPPYGQPVPGQAAGAPQPPAAPVTPPPPSAPQGFRARKLAELDQQYSNGEMPVDEYMKRRSEIMDG